MTMNRRTFVQLAAGAAVAISGSAAAANDPPASIKAIAFDGLALFDPRPVAALAERLFPGRGGELTALWRSRQFEYTWLRNSMGRYASFESVTRDALRFALASLALAGPAGAEAQLLEAFDGLRAWPDAPQVLRELHESGRRLALLSNFSAAMLERAVVASSLQGLFEPHLSTDLARAFKPDPRAYALAPAAFGIPVREIAFVAFGGWDAAGAKAVGFPTYWVNRMGSPAEELGLPPDAIASGLAGLPRFVEAP
jgi:2-haloacid dehalogenase